MRVYAHDEFDNVNGRSILAHVANDGGKWESVPGYEGLADIQNGRVRKVGDAPALFLHSGLAESPNVTVEAKFAALSDDDSMPCLLARMNGQTGYSVHFERGEWTFMKCVDGRLTYCLEFGATHPHTEGTFSVRFEVRDITDVSLKLFVNGVLLLEAVDHELPITYGGQAGFGWIDYRPGPAFNEGRQIMSFRAYDDRNEQLGTISSVSSGIGRIGG